MAFRRSSVRSRSAPPFSRARYRPVGLNGRCSDSRIILEPPPFLSCPIRTARGHHQAFLWLSCAYYPRSGGSSSGARVPSAGGARRRGRADSSLLPISRDNAITPFSPVVIHHRLRQPVRSGSFAKLGFVRRPAGFVRRFFGFVRRFLGFVRGFFGPNESVYEP